MFLWARPVFKNDICVLDSCLYKLLLIIGLIVEPYYHGYLEMFENWDVVFRSKVSILNRSKKHKKSTPSTIFSSIGVGNAINLSGTIQLMSPFWIFE
jgi:hypothetical protein